MPPTNQTDLLWPQDTNQRKGYKIYRNVRAVIENWKMREDASELCFVTLLGNNKPASIQRAIISKSGTCPEVFNPENYDKGDEICVDLCEPSRIYLGTAMANYSEISPSEALYQERLQAVSTSKEKLTDIGESTTKVVITNVPQSVKASWEVHCKQQGLKPWRAFKDLLDKNALPF